MTLRRMKAIRELEHCASALLAVDECFQYGEEGDFAHSDLFNERSLDENVYCD